FSDMHVMGAPEAKEIHNLETQLTPTANQNLHLTYWELGWNGIKYANTVISRIDDATFDTEADRNAILAEGYFHRAYWYYLLTNQWGDVPLILEEITGPKLDFVSSARSTVLTQMKADIEFEAQWLPTTAPAGAVNRATSEHLLTKIYMALGEFEDVVETPTRYINIYSIHHMNPRFSLNAEEDL